MTTLPVRPRKTDKPLTTKKIQRHKVTIISGNSHSRRIDCSNDVGYKKRRRDVSSVVEEPYVSSKRIKLKAGFSNRYQKSSNIKSNSNSKEELQCSTSPLAKYYESLSYESSNSPKSDPITTSTVTCHDELHQEDNRANSTSKNHGTDHKWKLRSQESSRFKSELSAYFPEYDVVIGNELQDEYVLKDDNPIIIYDSAKNSHPNSPTQHNDQYSLIEYPEALITDLNNAEKVDFSDLLNSNDDFSSHNLLCDAYFESMHRKPQRAEKTIRNTDRERAQHDRAQVARLLEGLQGQDWLKLMGVNGIPEIKKREYEAARQYFIRGCELIVTKFRLWRDEEKRQKIEKVNLTIEDNKKQVYSRREDNIQDSDSETSATQQLLHEATARSNLTLKKQKRKPAKLTPNIILPFERNPKSTSFYYEPYTHEAALRGLRNTGRIAVAWGHPIPHIPEQDFKLPEEFHDDRILRAYARKKRVIERDKKKFRKENIENLQKVKRAKA